ncbi:MAG TPA: hypothetical protein DFR83_05210, partial [Deltaproteobacteria bacterium]|nr:hypothetical protein [Deltaproteobacteria bacterium]
MKRALPWFQLKHQKGRPSALVPVPARWVWFLLGSVGATGCKSYKTELVWPDTGASATTAMAGEVDNDLDGHPAETDCDDNDPSMHPGADEVCDGKDNDCDGQIDEDFPTKNKACSVGVGECLRTGTNQCKSNGSGVQCSVSVGTPSAETCDGKDNDCDGLTDENWPTKGNACTSGKGLCRRAGTLICASNGAG